MNIYQFPSIPQSILDNFKPCRLAIKELNGIFYFCKSTKKNFLSYHGSGIKWKAMLKKYGRKNVKTHWVSDWYTDPYEIQKIALHFSYENDIDKSEKWANLKPENGLDGGSTSDIQSNPDVQAKKLATWAKNGRTFKGEQNPMFGISVGDGKDNPCYNHTLYDFYNTITHERIITTQHDLHQRFNLSRSHLCSIVNGDKLSIKNWRLYENKDKVVRNGRLRTLNPNLDYFVSSRSKI